MTQKIFNPNKFKISSSKMKKIESLFKHTVYNFPWNGWIKDRKGYYTYDLIKATKTKLIFKIYLPGEAFDLNVHTDRQQEITRIFIVKPRKISS